MKSSIVRVVLAAFVAALSLMFGGLGSGDTNAGSFGIGVAYADCDHEASRLCGPPGGGGGGGGAHCVRCVGKANDNSLYCAPDSVGGAGCRFTFDNEGRLRSCRTYGSCN